MTGTRYTLEVNPQIPEHLSRLEEFSNNLWYSWDRHSRGLFVRLGIKLWGTCGHSPKAMLRRANQSALEELADDPSYLGMYARVSSSFDNYFHNIGTLDAKLPAGEHVAYFCAEFGFHESLPIYSGGLGILAGDHCKTASDFNLSFTAVGLLYRQGYFQQNLDGAGRQRAEYSDAIFEDLPIEAVRNAQGEDLTISVPFPGRDVKAKVWRVHVGRVNLILLDSALPENSEHDRDITFRLYGGDRTTRIEQEIFLGIGGVKALTALGIKPTVWHINEGHAAFLILERARALVEQGMDFDSAMEALAVNTVFTTHTVVPAGHDHFSHDMMRHYFGNYCQAAGCSMDKLLSLGNNPSEPDFNMTALAIRGSRYQNGVSKIHGTVSAQACAYIWPQLDSTENPMSSVTNGVHVPTFLSEMWNEVFDRYIGVGWQRQCNNPEAWQGVFKIPDLAFWGVRQSLKSKLLYMLAARVRQQNERNQISVSQSGRMLKYINPENPNVLMIGFARRFATYKRATLLFQDLEWLKRIVADKERPVVFVFAGKAHPADIPGQAIIQRIAEVSLMPEFIGHILLIEGYDLHVARRLVAGVDVWLNNPVYPLEASGTSGMKAALNGVLNLSVLDGWWGEICDDRPGFENGWGIKPVNTSGVLDDPRRDSEEARILYEIIQDRVIPMYYDWNRATGYPTQWVASAKRTIAAILPQFCTDRMLAEYIENAYAPAAQRWQRISTNNFAGARTLATWKAKVASSWPGVTVRRVDQPPSRLVYGDKIAFQVMARLNGLTPQDVTVELLFGHPMEGEEVPGKPSSYKLAYLGDENGESRFQLELQPELCGKIEYRLRMYPSHELLSHPFELGMMVWL